MQNRDDIYRKQRCGLRPSSTWTQSAPLAEFLYSPLLKDKVRKIQENDSGVYGAQVAAEVHNELKKHGGVKPPQEFVFMDRAAVGLGSVFMHLKAEINWYRIFHDLIKDFSEKELNKRQQKALKLSNL